jgi:1-acyl-sn-glycerol-3-phosphate acyltransferase
MLRSARTQVDSGRHLLIMPEGTRMPPGRTGRYHPGVYALYKYLGMPVVPVAHNAGLFWPRSAFLKRPGTITIEFLEPIAPGQDREAFMAMLEDRIETAARRLYDEGRADARGA